MGEQLEHACKDYQPLHVLHVLGPLRPSGMERMLVSAAPYFTEASANGIVYGQLDGSTFADELINAGYEVVLGKKPTKSLKTAIRFRKLITKHKINVVHIHTEADYLRTVFLARWALGSRGAIVRTVHGNFLTRGSWRFKRQVQSRIADYFVSSLIAPSSDVAETEKSTIGRKCQVIYNWVDDRFFQLRSRQVTGKRLRSPVALIVGNCSEVKAHEIAIKAVIDAGWQLIHIGDETGASQEELAMLELLQVENRLLKRGVHAPDDSLCEADIFLMPSEREGMGVAFAEALVTGLPALVRDAPGFGWAREFPGVRYLSDDPKIWVEALCNFEESSHLRIDVESPPIDLSSRRGAREYLQVYRQAVGDLPKGGA